MIREADLAVVRQRHTVNGGMRSPFLSISVSVVVMALIIAVVLGSYWRQTQGSDRQGSGPAAQVPTRDEGIDRFMAIGHTKTASTQDHHHDEPACVPCGSKGKEPKEGFVPSRSPPHRIDEPVLRITGRSHDFTPPHDNDKCLLKAPLSPAAWVMMATGEPYRQVRCYVSFEKSGVTASQFSDELSSLAPVHLTTDGKPPARLEEFGALLIEGIKELRSIQDDTSATMAVGDVMGSFRAVSVSPQRLFFVSSKEPQAEGNFNDLQIRMDSYGKMVSWERVRVATSGKVIRAARTLWLFDNDKH